MPSWLSYLLPAAASFAGSAATGGRQRSKTNQRTSQTNRSTATTGTRRFMNPAQEAVMGQTGEYISNMMRNPGAMVQPARTAAVNSVNNTFANAGGMIRSKFGASGGNASGRGGRAGREVEMARLGGINDTNLQFDQKALDLQQLAAQLGLNFSGINLGQDTTINSSSESNGTLDSETVGTQPGGMLGQGVGGGLSTLATLVALNRMLNGGGGGSLGGFMQDGDFGGET